MIVAFTLRDAILGVCYGLTASLLIAAIAWLTPKQDDRDPWSGREGEE